MKREGNNELYPLLSLIVGIVGNTWSLEGRNLRAEQTLHKAFYKHCLLSSQKPSLLELANLDVSCGFITC